MQTYLIDTNGYLRLILNDIPEQANTITELLHKAKLGTISVFLPEVVVFELVYALEKFYKLERNTVIDKLLIVVSTPYLIVEHRDILIPVLKAYRNSPVSFSDNYLLCKSLKFTAELFTFDKKLKKMKP